MRLKKIPYAKEYLTKDETVIHLHDQTPKLVLSPNMHMELEIGCGKGDFIISKTLANPNKNYYAIEKFDSVLIRAVEKKAEKQLKNLTFILGDAKDLTLLFPKNSLETIYLNFSDPWPKKRHEKRRLTFRDKLAKYQALLTQTGVIEMKTDNQDLFAYSLTSFIDNGWEIIEQTTDLYNENSYAEIKMYQTEYEKRFIKKALPICYCKVRVKA